MAVRQREYLLSVNIYNEPAKAEQQSAIALLLIRLILLEPGSDPLHPLMGVGIRKYRYALNQLEELQKRIEDQIATYLPEYQNATVALIRTPDKLCNIEITIDDVTYVYDSSIAPIPISLEDVQSR
jgi:hypothetical protein